MKKGRLLVRRRVLVATLTILVALLLPAILAFRVAAAPKAVALGNGSLASYAGEQDSENSGWSVAAVGDANGDGIGDVLIGAPGYDDPTLGLGAGRAYLAFGRASGWSTNLNVTSANVIFTGDQDLTQAGFTVAAAGDVNHDGLADFLIAAPFKSATGYESGKVYLFLGRTNWASNYTVDQADASFLGEAGTDRAGTSMAAAGDFNGDGFGDFLVGSPGNDQGGTDAGKTYLILGKATGWAPNTSLANADASFYGTMTNATHPFGTDMAMTVARAGDINGDGLDDLLIGNPGVSIAGKRDYGQVYIIFGRTVGWMKNLNLSKADVAITGGASGDRLGWGASFAGDVNGDGFDDFFLGAPWNSSGGDRAGTTYLFLGKAGGWAKQGSLSTASATFFGVNALDHSGFSLSGGFDVNGDGLSDLLISAHTSGNSQQGAAYVVLGRRSGWKVGDSLLNASITYTGEGPYDWAGYSLSMGPDVNGDGNDDVVIGAPWDSYGGGMLENGKAYITVPQINIKPSTPTAIKILTPGTTTAATRAELGRPLTVEIDAPDKDSARANLVHARVASSIRDTRGIDLRLVETGLNTGIFQGSLMPMDMSHAVRGWIGAGPGETLTVTSVDAPTLSASLPVTFTNSQNLSSFPAPFIQGGLLNATLVVGNSIPHYPAGGANTIDTVGAETVAMRLGRQSTGGELRGALDSEMVTSPDGISLVMTGTTGNLISFGGEGGNLVTRAYNGTMPIVQTKGAVRPIPTGTQYRRIGTYGQGTPVTDYGYVAMGYDRTVGRYILAVSGLSGFVTRALAQALADGTLALNGQGAVVALYDANGDNKYESLSVAEVVWSERSLRGSSAYVFKPEIQPLETTALSLPVALVGGGTLSATVVVAYSLPHTPVSAASTIDVVGSLPFSFKLGRATTKGPFSALLDIDAATYNSATSTIVVTAPGNLVSFGGRGNNLVSRYYNQTLPVHLEASKGVYVLGTGHSYVRKVNGTVATDYAFYSGTFDSQRQGWAYVVAGISGFATRGIGGIIGGRILPMDSMGAVLGLVDLNNDGIYEQYNNVETSGGPAALSDYPYPFRSVGILNGSVVVGVSQAHAPANAANTIDAVGGVVLGMGLGRGSSGGRLDALLDTEAVASYDGRTIVPLLGGNMISLGGQGSNLLTRYYNLSTSVGPVRYNNKTYLEVFGSRDLYGRTTSGSSITDYAYIALVQDQALGREILILAGLSGFSTRRAAELLASGGIPMVGTGMILRLNDTNGDNIFESYDIVENTGPVYTGHAYVTTSPTLPVAVTCNPTSVPLNAFPCPYVSNRVLNGTLVLGYSLPHGGINGASTIDVLGGVLIGVTLGRASTSGAYSAKLDIDVTSSDGLTLTQGGNLLSIGGRGGNTATKIMNPSLPTRQALASDGTGRGLYSTLSGKNYVITTATNGTVDNYAMVSWIYNNTSKRFLGQVVGLSGFSTRAMNKLLALDPSGLLSGTGVIVDLRDWTGDGVIDTYQAIDGSGSFVAMPKALPMP